MLNLLLVVVALIAVTFGLVWIIDKFIPNNFRKFILVFLYILVGFLAYNTFMSVYGEIQFNHRKQVAYKKVIKSLIDIRDAQLAHKTVTGTFQKDFDKLISFIDTAQFTITQRRDSTVLDVEMTRRFGGVETFKEIIVIDTLGYVRVKDSLFGNDSRYKSMMNVPVGKEGTTFEMNAGTIDQNGVRIPVFEAKVLKKYILFGEDANLIAIENNVVSVDGVNGAALRVGSMEEVNTNGNWPKNFSND